MRYLLVVVGCLGVAACQLVAGQYSVGDTAASDGGPTQDVAASDAPEEQPMDAGSDSGSPKDASAACTTGTADLTPSTGTPSYGLFYAQLGYLVTFTCTTSIDGVEFLAPLAKMTDAGTISETAVAYVWDASGNVVATGSPVLPADENAHWYRSNMSAVLQANTQYVIGISVSDGFWMGNVWFNVSFPFTASGASIVESCSGGGAGDGGPACSNSGQGFPLRIVTP